MYHKENTAIQLDNKRIEIQNNWVDKIDLFTAQVMEEQCLSITFVYISNDRNSKLISKASIVYLYIHYWGSLTYKI